MEKFKVTKMTTANNNYNNNATNSDVSRVIATVTLTHTSPLPRVFTGEIKSMLVFVTELGVMSYALLL